MTDNTRQVWDVKLEVNADTNLDLHKCLSAVMSALAGSVIVTHIEKRDRP